MNFFAKYFVRRKGKLLGFDTKYNYFKNTDRKMHEGNWQEEGWGIPV